MKNKRGLSAIVATLLIILLTIIAFSIVSVVVKNTVKNNAEKINIGQKCIDIEMHPTSITKVLGTNYFDIGFTRSVAGDTIKGIKVILTDANGTTRTKDLIKDINGGDKWVETNMSFDDAVDFVPTQITLIPFFMRESGDIYYCDGVQYSEDVTMDENTGSQITGNAIATGDVALRLSIDPSYESSEETYLTDIINAYSGTGISDAFSNILNEIQAGKDGGIITQTRSKEVAGVTTTGTIFDLDDCYKTQLSSVLAKCNTVQTTDATLTKTATTACDNACYSEGIANAISYCENLYGLNLGEGTKRMEYSHVYNANGDLLYTWERECVDYEDNGGFTHSACGDWSCSSGPCP